MVAFGLVLAAAAAVTPPAPRPSMAVVVVGADAGQAGALQDALDSRLIPPPSVVLVPSGELATRLETQPLSLLPDPAALARAAELLSAAKKDYFEDRLAHAIDSLSSLLALEERDGRFPLADRVRLRLWRASVYLALDDHTQADREIGAALSLSPDWVVDTAEFRPRVRDAVVAARASLKVVSVTLPGLASNAIVRVDGGVTELPVRVVAGVHSLSVWAPGRREVTRDLDLTADQAVRICLPLAVGQEAESVLTEVARKSAVDPALLPAVADLTGRLGSSWLLLVGVDSKRAVLLRPGTPAASIALPPRSDAVTALASWLSSEVARTSTPSAPVRALPAEKALALEAQAGSLFTIWSRKVSGGPSYAATFPGMGPEIALCAARGPWIARLDLDYLLFAFSNLTVTLPDGSTQTRNGGSAFDVILEAGWRGDFAKVSGGLAYHQHSVQDLEAPGGGDFGLLTSSREAALRLDAEVGRTFRLLHVPVMLSAQAMLEPIGSLAESPSGATGSSTGNDFGAGLGAAARFYARSGLSIDIGYSLEMRSTTFSGMGSAQVSPPLQNATLSQIRHDLAVTARLPF